MKGIGEGVLAWMSVVFFDIFFLQKSSENLPKFKIALSVCYKLGNYYSKYDSHP